MPALPESRAIRAGLVVFAIGVVFVLIDVTPFFFGDHDRPLWLNLACLAAPLGFAIALGAAIRSGRADQRRAVN